MNSVELTDAELARRIGATKGAVGRWRAGARTPTVTFAWLLECASEGAVPMTGWADEEHLATVAIRKDGIDAFHA